MAAVEPVEAVPVPRSKPVASSIQLASADMQSFQAASAPRPPKPIPAAEAKTQTPTDIINARGFWGDVPAPKQATPAQVAAISARQALAAADPQPTASVSAAFEALAYAPAAVPSADRSNSDRSNVVTASAPIPRIIRPASPARSPMAVNNITTVVAKAPPGKGVAVANATRIAARKPNDVWMRAMIVAQSASNSMSMTTLGDAADMTLMRSYFVKPQAAVAMTFSDDPQLGLVCDQFTGSAVANLATQSFVVRTASLR